MTAAADLRPGRSLADAHAWIATAYRLLSAQQRGIDGDYEKRTRADLLAAVDTERAEVRRYSGEAG